MKNYILYICCLFFYSCTLNFDIETGELMTLVMGALGVPLLGEGVLSTWEIPVEEIVPIEGILTDIKILAGNKKKVITTCVFVPQEASVSQKMFYYITGLIKSVETFKVRMPGWIYRIYYDSMFDDEGIKVVNDGVTTYKHKYNNTFNTHRVVAFPTIT